jgi:hypothetical protein
MRKPSDNQSRSRLVISATLTVIVVLGSASGYVYERNAGATTTSTNQSNRPESSSSSDYCKFRNSMGCHWYIGAPVLALLYRANPRLAQQYFDYPTTFVAVTKPEQLSNIPSAWKVTPIFTFFDETKLHASIVTHSLPSGIKGVSLDDELAVCKVYGQHECTPQAEQSNPVQYEQDAASLTKLNHLVYLDVGAAPDPANSGNRWHAAAFASYVDSQIQLSEVNLTRFTHESNTYLSGWRSAVRIYSPDRYPGATGTTAEVIDGITAKVAACPAGQRGCRTYKTATPAQMEAAVKATMSSGIWGYWLNCPSGRTPGPGPCDQADVSAMEAFLKNMLTVFMQT